MVKLSASQHEIRLIYGMSSSDSDEDIPQNRRNQKPSRWSAWRKRQRRSSDAENVSDDESVEEDSSDDGSQQDSTDGGVSYRPAGSEVDSSGADTNHDENHEHHAVPDNAVHPNALQVEEVENLNEVYGSDGSEAGDIGPENAGVGNIAVAPNNIPQELDLAQPAVPNNIAEQVVAVEGNGHMVNFNIAEINAGIEEAQEQADVRDSDSDANESGGEDQEVWHDSEENYSEDEDVAADEAEELLYPNAPITVLESLLTVLTLVVKHGLSGKCTTDILELIKLHCPPDSHCITTLYKLKKYFSLIGSSALKLHYYCSGCVVPLEDQNSICPECYGGNEVTFFIEIPIVKQLQTLMKRPNFFNDLQYRFHRVQRGPNYVEDVYDGQMYKDLFENNGFLSNPNNISLFWYTDGVPIYHTSKFQIWPLYFRINELSPSKRILRENTLLAGLWFGPHKINPNVFLSPFHTSLNEFQEHGFEMQVPGVARPIHMKGRLLLGVGDLPALAAIMRFKQFNGSFGCTRCVTEGQRYVIGNGTVQVYPYSRDFVLRNNADIPGFAAEATRLRQRNPNASVFGVIGPSLLYSMVPNMVRCTGKDKMHGVDSGVGKQVLILMSDAMYSGEPFSIRDVIRNVDQRLSKIKPPSFVQRVPCSIEKDLSLWHSQDYRHWLMYYSVPVLLGLLDPEYLQHHCLLLSAVFLLNQVSISYEQIETASELLHLYVSKFQELFGLRHLGMNVHQLLHLAEVVKDLGPLWVNSCYSFEDLNGKLKKMIHGTRHAGMQLCSAASTYLNLPAYVRGLPEDSAARQFCEKLDRKEACVKIADEIRPGVYAVGTYLTGDDELLYETRLALQGLGIEGGNLKYFYRLRDHGVLYYSSNYPRDLQKESTYIEFSHDNVPKLGRIQQFFKWTNCGGECNPNCHQCPSRYFCIAVVYERQPWFVHTVPHVRLPYLNKVISTPERVVFPVENLLSLCFYIHVDDNEYIVKPVNLVEGN